MPRGGDTSGTYWGSGVGDSSGVADTIGVGEDVNVGDGSTVAVASGVVVASGISVGVGEPIGVADAPDGLPSVGVTSGSKLPADPSVDGLSLIVPPLLLGAGGVLSEGPGMTITRGVGTVEAKSKFKILGSLLNLPIGCQPPLKSP